MVDRQVARVVSLFRYPVKSMAAEVLDEVDVSWQGMAGDRRWAFVQDGLVRSGVPLANDPRTSGHVEVPSVVR